MERFTCEDISAVLSGLLDGELDSDTQHRAEVHLAQCDACRAIVDGAEALDGAVRQTVVLREQPWSDDLERKILIEINDPIEELRTIRRLRRSAWVGWLTAVAATIVVASLLIFEWSQQSPLQGRSDSTFATNSPNGDDDNDRVAIGVLPDSTIPHSNEIDDVPTDDDGLAQATDSLDNVHPPIPETQFAVSESIFDVARDYKSAFEWENVIFDRDQSSNSDFGASIPSAHIEDAPLMPALIADADDIDNMNESFAELAGSPSPNSATILDELDNAQLAMSIENTDWQFGTGDVLYSSAVLLQTLEQANVNSSYADVREINSALEFDDVLEMLAASRDEMEADDAAIVDRAWAALEWVSGPIDPGQLSRIQQMITDEELASRLEVLSDKYATY